MLEHAFPVMFVVKASIAMALLCAKALSRRRSGWSQVTLADFRVAETRVQPSAMREVALEVCASTQHARLAHPLCEAS